MESSQLNKEEYSRYHRHLIMPEFNLQAQLALKNAKVLVVGAGGLGTPVLQYLTAAGVGTIGILDFDMVSASNLQRQVLFNEQDIGKPKAEVAAKRLKLQNSSIHIETYVEKINSENALELISIFDLVVDGTDNFPTRYLINDACCLLDKVNVYGAVFRFEGQVAVFNYQHEDTSRSCNYRDLFPSPPIAGSTPNCSEAGVLGVLPGIIGSMQAAEVIKVITGIGEPLVDKLYTLDTLSWSNYTITIKKHSDNPLRGNPPSLTKLIDYDAFCGISHSTESARVKAISSHEFSTFQQSEIEFQLIDVRSAKEHIQNNIGGESMPLEVIENYIDQIRRDKKVVLYCQSGKRSRQAVNRLQQEFGFSNLYNLEGGVLAQKK